VLIAFFGFCGMLAIAFVGAVAIEMLGATTRETRLEQVFVFTAYASLFALFIVGLVAWLRSRNSSPWVARLITCAVLFLIAAGPWVVAAIGGAIADSHDKAWLVVASPSPLYAVMMVGWLDRTSPDAAPIIGCGLGCAMMWGFLGFGLLAAAARRCARTVAQHDAAVAQAEAALQAEDDTRRAEAIAPALPDGTPVVTPGAASG